jgi:hypothetical protein
MTFDWDKIKIKNKFIFFKYNSNLKNKISTLAKDNNKKIAKNKLKGKKVNKDEEVVLIEIQLKKDWTPDTKIPVYMLGGPVKIKFYFYKPTERNTLKKFVDKRSVQIIYYTYDFYLKNKIKSKDLKKLALLAVENKLEKRPLAPKLITQINKF